MAFGVLEDRHLARPTGTALLEGPSKAFDSDLPDNTSHLQKDGNIVLVPQPSGDPNDPLNWSKHEKWIITILISIMSTTTSSMAAMLTPAIPIISEQYQISADAVNTWTIGLLTFWTGFAAFFTAAGANVIGKRPFILGSLFVMLLTNVWGASATSFASLAIVRTLQGIASAPYETMVTATVADLYFLHQRGIWLALWGVIINGGILAGQVISGVIIEKFGYSATFGVSAGIFVILLIAGYFLLVETTYSKKRPDPVAEVNTANRVSWMDRLDNKLPAIQEVGILDGQDKTLPALPVFPSDYEHPRQAPQPSKVTYAQRRRILRGRISDAKYFKELLKPFPLVLYPAVAYGSIVNGIVSALLIAVSILATLILAVPPYNLTPSQLGLVNVAPFFAGLIASPISGWMTDAVAKWMARRNNGVFEPEFRLTVMVIGTPLITISLVGFGEAIERQQPLPVVFMWLSIQSFATPFLIQGALSYVLDNHTHDANLAFVAISFFRALFSFIATSFVAGLLASMGPRAFFVAVAALTFGVLMLTLPLYIFGKRLRSAVDRSAIGRRIAAANVVASN